MKKNALALSRVLTCAITLLAACASALPPGPIGPASSQTPYLLGKNGWTSTVQLTVGDRVNSYTLVGVQDGLGAYLNDNKEMVVLINHELGNNAGVVRAHGQKGAFVSESRIDPAKLHVLGGRDLIRNPILETGSPSFGRLFSADLPAVSAFFNPDTGLGTQNRIFMNGEENGPGGRALAHIASGPQAGTSHELRTDLPRAGPVS